MFKTIFYHVLVFKNMYLWVGCYVMGLKFTLPRLSYHQHFIERYLP
jgi:hypothetical protein